jgi:hypothetical protein
MRRVDKGDWTLFRNLPGLVEIDFHYGRREGDLLYEEAMATVYDEALRAIREAYDAGQRYVEPTKHARAVRDSRPTEWSLLAGGRTN